MDSSIQAHRFLLLGDLKSPWGSKREKTSQPSKGKKAGWDLIVCPKVDRGKAKINIDAIGPSHPFDVFVPLAKAFLRDPTHTPAI